MESYVILELDADEDIGAFTQGTNFSLSGPETGTTGGTINFYTARLTTDYANSNSTFTGVMKGYNASSVLGYLNTTGEVYGFYSELNQNNRLGNAVKNYNFYAAGSAPNYFAGPTSIGQNTLTPGWDFTNGSPGVKLTTAGCTLSRNDGDAEKSTLYIQRSGNNFGSYIRFYGAGVFGGYIARSGSGVLYATDSSGTPAFVELADARRKTLTAFSGAATDIIKAINPGLNGFIAHELQAAVPNAVTGTQDETEAIGTFTDADGSVETEVTEPEAIPFGATWTQTGTRDVYQGVDHTKLIPLLTKALQEALDKIETLETRLNDAGIA